MTCSIVDCQKDAVGRLWEGRLYCFEHYDELMSNAFNKEYSSWDGSSHPSPWLRSLIGRYIDEKWEVKNGLLSKARIRDRAFNFEKNDEGFTFEITRHPGAFKNDYVTHRIVQKWKVSLQDGIAEFIGERRWTENDPDNC